jgi:hypothetical protein
MNLSPHRMTVMWSNSKLRVIGLPPVAALCIAESPLPPNPDQSHRAGQVELLKVQNWVDSGRAANGLRDPEVR